jgi:hypothetical protein
MYNDTMCTHTSIDTALDYWQRVAETLNRLASQNGDDVPHNNKELFNLIHSSDRSDWQRVISLVQLLKHQHPEMFNVDHADTLVAINTILFTDYPALFDDENPMDYFHRNKVSDYLEQPLSKWGFKGLVMLREVWNNCEVGNNPQRTKQWLRHQQEITFKKMFEIKHGKGTVKQAGAILKPRSGIL